MYFVVFFPGLLSNCMWWEAQEGWRWIKRENMYRESDGQTDGDRDRQAETDSENSSCPPLSWAHLVILRVEQLLLSTFLWTLGRRSSSNGEGKWQTWHSAGVGRGRCRAIGVGSRKCHAVMMGIGPPGRGRMALRRV